MKRVLGLCFGILITLGFIIHISKGAHADKGPVMVMKRLSRDQQEKVKLSLCLENNYLMCQMDKEAKLEIVPANTSMDIDILTEMRNKLPDHYGSTIKLYGAEVDGNLHSFKLVKGGTIAFFQGPVLFGLITTN